MNRRFVQFAFLLMTVVIATSLVLPARAQDPTGNMIALDHPYAPFLESRAYGASMGATAEFLKMEWVVLDNTNMKYYVSMSNIGASMSDGAGDISIDEDPCGIVYTADLTADYNITEMRPLVVGGPFDGAAAPNMCALDNISNPDGLALDARGRLWIAEDTSYHENNMLWVYDPTDASLKRFATVPLGAELTGPYITAQGTLLFSSQHPHNTNTEPFNAGTVVVINGFNANTDDFEPLAVPEGDAKLTITVAAGTVQVLARSGDPIPNSADGQVFGAINTVSGEPILVSNSPDGLMWLPTDETGTSATLYFNYEGAPGGVGRVTVTQTTDGWEVTEGHMVDFSSVRGTWLNCGSSVTPWNTGLTAEEYEPIASDFANVGGMDTYLGAPANPYDYGWIVELVPDGATDVVTKHYVMGRKSNEIAAVAADGKTTYFGDDGNNTMLFKFVATNAGDLSAGTLYAAKITQTGGTSLTDHRFGIEWIELGTATNAEIEAAIRELDR
ncbi:MAG: hypothetical protein BroJett018_32930 [Chloroflexota bacterium]|nr:MAG: hypothetical protein BroJett018_32930 [Chloroflexota bacterium]